MREVTGHNHFDDPFGPSDHADRRLRLRAGEGKGYVVGKPYSSPIPEHHLGRQMVSW